VNKRRVVVTGVGMVTALGNNAPDTWKGLIAGLSGVGQIDRFDTSNYSTTIAAQVKGFDPNNYVEKKEVKKMDLFIHYAIAAADEAVSHAALKITEENSDRIGVYIGSGIGGFGVIEREHEMQLAQGPRRISPFFIPAAIVNLAAGQVSIRLRARGPNSAPCTACSSGTHAIGDAFKVIQRDDADVMIAGGTEGAITPMGVGGFCAMRALSTRNSEPQKASRPFDKDRDGFVIGEGSGILVLEAYEYALARNAPILAEIVGYGMSADAHHITSPSGDGAIRVMRNTLRDGGVTPEEVDYINAHGTSTLPNDRSESAAIREVFGKHAYKVAVSSTKSMMGHLLGAAGGVEGVISVLSLIHQIAPPTINLDTPDPECDLDYVPHQARPMPIRLVLSNSFAFGGTNACILLKKYPD
jgi:3-oxoacyl-[acyl-carrier-protein] synthase II